MGGWTYASPTIAWSCVSQALYRRRAFQSGIIIPDTAKEKPIQGEIIAVGQGRVAEDGKIRPLDVKKGDRVLFGKYAGTEIKIDGEDFLMMREEDILGVFNS